MQGALTDYVSTRWYRAPELLLGSTVYGFEVDQWAIGCIMGELIDGQPLFPGESDIDQLYIIQRQLGGLTQSQMDLFLRNPRFVGLKFPDMSRPETIEAKYGNKLTGHALSFMKALLRIDPAERLTGADCLSHPYFDGVHDPHPLRVPAAGGAGLGRSHTPTAAAAAPKVEKRASRVAAKPVPPSTDPEEQERLRREQRRRENEARLLRERNEVRPSCLPCLNDHTRILDSPAGGLPRELGF